MLAAALSQPTEYDRAVAFIRDRDTITAAELSVALGLSVGVCKGFIAKLVTAKMITPPNDVNRSLVVANMHRLPTAKTYDEMDERSQATVDLVMAVSEQVGIDPVTVLRLAQGGQMQAALDIINPVAAAMAEASAIAGAVDKALDKAGITSGEVIAGAAQTRLRTIIDRIQRLNEDKAAISADISEVFTEAKGEGFDTKILRKVIRILGQDKAKRMEEEALLDLYMSAIGEGDHA